MTYNHVLDKDMFMNFRNLMYRFKYINAITNFTNMVFKENNGNAITMKFYVKA